VGVVCKQDLRTKASAVPVAELMRQAPLVSPSDSLAHVAEQFGAACSCMVPVCVTGHWFGILTRGDLARANVGGPWPRCAACRSHHRVRSAGDSLSPFCARCLDDLRPAEFDDLYVDTGVGD
jgi:hypothetical protein